MFDKRKLNILAYLAKLGSPQTTYSMAKDLNMDRSQLTYHLDQLSESDIVEKIYVCTKCEEGFLTKKEFNEHAAHNGFKTVYAIDEKKVFSQDGMIIAFVEGNPIVFNCRYWNECKHHDACGTKKCLLRQNELLFKKLFG